MRSKSKLTFNVFFPFWKKKLISSFIKNNEQKDPQEEEKDDCR